MAADRTDSLDPFKELLADHSRLLEEKQRARESRQPVSTSVNYELTQLVERLVAQAQARREAAGDGGTEAVRSLLAEEAAGGSLAAEDALEWLAEKDPWWGERRQG